MRTRLVHTVPPTVLQALLHVACPDREVVMRRVTGNMCALHRLPRPSIVLQMTSRFRYFSHLFSRRDGEELAAVQDSHASASIFCRSALRRFSAGSTASLAETPAVLTFSRLGPLRSKEYGVSDSEVRGTGTATHPARRRLRLSWFRVFSFLRVSSSTAGGVGASRSNHASTGDKLIRAAGNEVSLASGRVSLRGAESSLCRFAVSATGDASDLTLVCMAASDAFDSLRMM